MSARLASLAAIALASAPAAAAPTYCVSPIPLTRLHPAGVTGQQDGPTRFFGAGELANPLPVSELRTPNPAGGYNLHWLFWRLTPDRRIEGPWRLPARLNERQRLGEQFILASETASALPAKPLPATRFHLVSAGSLPQPLPEPPDYRQWQATGATPDPQRGGLIVDYWGNPPGKMQEQARFLLRPDGYRRLASRTPLPRFQPLPGSNLLVSTTNDLRFTEPGSATILHLNLPQSGEWRSGWESVTVDRDGWIFAEGDSNDFAIRLGHENGALSLDRLYRYSGGTLAKWFDWPLSFGSRRSFWSAQSVQFSPLLRLTFFAEPVKVIRHGLREDLGAGDSRLDSYIGDADGIGAAMFRGKNGELFAYDGETLQLVAGSGQIAWLGMRNIPEIGRTFISLRGNLHELTGRVPHVQLRPLSATSMLTWQGPTFRGQAGRRSASFVRFPGSRDVLAFGRTGIAQYRGDQSSPFWQFAGPIAKDAEAFTAITPVGLWNGVLFQTTDRQFHLVHRCGAPTTAK